MKTAKLFVVSYSLECPHCGDLLTDSEYGSQVFEWGLPHPNKIKCEACGEESKWPDPHPLGSR